MLKSLLIQNFAIIDKIELEFVKGLNILTGETGAGKSVIVDALMMLLGGRITTDVIRSGQKKAIIEGTFELKRKHPVISILSENGFDTDDSILIIRREILDKGISRNFVNDSPIQAGLLKKCGELLVDFHGQHDHQSLLKSETHIEILDSFGTYTKLIKEFSSCYQRLKELINKKSELKKKHDELYSSKEYQNLKLKEIEKVDPKPDEDNLIESELLVLENAEELFSLTSEINSIINEGDNSVRTKISDVLELAGKLRTFDNRFNDYYDDIKSAAIIIDELSSFVDNYRINLEFDTERIESLRMRLIQIKGLQKKYGTISNILIEKQKLSDSLKLLENFTNEINEYDNLIRATQIELGTVTHQLSLQRRQTAIALEKSIEKTLKELGIENAVFNIKFSYDTIEQSELKRSGIELIAKVRTDFSRQEFVSDSVSYDNYLVYPNGIDKVEFFISPNIGEEPKPLSQTASGGEVSRVMLAIKNSLLNSEEIQLLVFDEIDNGISGRIAQKAGAVMKRLAGKHQIIAITHLPQIAAYAHRNISIKKFEKNNHTHIIGEIVEGNKKIYEIAKLFSGEIVNDIAMQNAKRLISESK